MPKPRVYQRHDQLIPVNKLMNEIEQLERGLVPEERKKVFFFHILLARVLTLNWVLNFMSTKVKETKINPR
jgi:hypothetical protein